MKTPFMTFSQCISVLGKLSIYLYLISITNTYATELNDDSTMPSLSSLENIEPVLTLSDASSRVLENDFSLARSVIQSQKFAAEAEAVDRQPDPTLFASMQNLPTDTFDLDQEAMTQLRVGVKQMFSKGNTLSLSKKIIHHDQTLEDIKRDQRVLVLKQQVEHAWLNAWYWQTYRDLIEEDRVFLTQMRDFIQTIYESGGKDQSDLIGAELELVKLDESVLEAHKQYEISRHRLNTLANFVFPELRLATELNVLPHSDLPSENQLLPLLMQHPDIQLFDVGIAQLSDRTQLMAQDTQPQWGMELSYGLRHGDNPNGSSRSDLLTAGISVQLPLFSGRQKNQKVIATRYEQSTLENKRLEHLTKVQLDLENLDRQYRNTQAQIDLYTHKILPTLATQKDSALQSYESDKGDFSVVTNLYLKEQTTRIKLQRLRVDAHIIISKMNYWLNADTAQLNKEGRAQ